MSVPLPDIPEAECTPLVRQLLDIIGHLQNRIQELEDEILRLKGLKTRPIIAPSPLETPPRPPRDPGQKRPGSAKRLKTAQLTITDEVVVPLADPPPGSIFKGYEDFVVQDLIIRPRVIRYRRERWQTPDGQNLVAGLPADVRPDSHFGPTLISLHPPPVSPPARHPAVALGTVGPTGHRHLHRPTQPDPDRREGRLSPGEGRTAARRVGGLDLRAGG